MSKIPDEAADLRAFPHRTTVAAKGREISRLLEDQPLFAGKRLELVRITHSTHSAFLEYRDPASGSDSPPLLVKYIMVSSGPQQAAETVCREFTALQTARTLAGTDFTESIPNPLLALPEAGLMVTQKLGGIALNHVLRRNANWMAPFYSTRVRAIAYDVGLWLGRFHNATRQPDARLDATAFECEILQQVERCKRRGLSPAATQEVIRIASKCSRMIEGRPLPTASRHGDFTPRNILLDGQQIRILDFENFAKSDTVYEDVGKFLAYLALLRGRPAYSTYALTSVRQFFLAGYGNSLDRNIVDLFVIKAATLMMANRGIRRVSSFLPFDYLYVRQFLRLCARTDAGFSRLP